MVNVLNIGVIGHRTLNVDRVRDFKVSIEKYYTFGRPVEYKLTNKNINWLFNRYNVALCEITAYTMYSDYKNTPTIMDREANRIKISDWGADMELEFVHKFNSRTRKLIKYMRGTQINKKHRVFIISKQDRKKKYGHGGFVLGIYMRDYLGFDCVVVFEPKPKRKRYKINTKELKLCWI